MNQNHVCSNCGDHVRGEVQDVPVLCQSCGLAREIQEAQWEREFDRMERNDAEADVDSMHRNGWCY